MLENVNLKRKLSADEYNRFLPALQLRLYDLEKACWDLKIRSVLVFEGWDAAGKGTSIATLTQRLDPRGFKLHSITHPRSFELSRPWLWRFWLRVPDQGEMAIFDQSWYMRVLQERVEKIVPESTWRAAYSDIVDFERMQADDGIVILKFFLHISRKEQEKRFRKLEADPLESWRITKEDWARHKHYNEYVAASEEMLEKTDTAEGPWTVVEATSRRWAKTKILNTIIAALEHRLGPDAPPREASEEAAASDADLRIAMESLSPSPENLDA
ncbi:MAG: AMP-polyphosphate phosphotransferase [Bryobacterales bacterium]|nr:AMP-polyphosphate phosphotransferase [Bryobacterales bacterium]